MPIFQYPKEDQDFLASITRTFMRHINDIRITLQHLTVADAVLKRVAVQTAGQAMRYQSPNSRGESIAKRSLRPLPCSMRSSMRSESMSDTLC